MGKCADKKCLKKAECISNLLRYSFLHGKTFNFQGGVGQSTTQGGITLFSCSIANMVPIQVERNDMVTITFENVPPGTLIGGYFVGDGGQRVPFGIFGINAFLTWGDRAVIELFNTGEVWFTLGLGGSVNKGLASVGGDIVYYLFTEAVFLIQQ